MAYEVARQIDARGSYCPGPLMELVRAVKEMETGQVVDLLSSDEGSVKDIPKWVDKAGHKMIEIKDDKENDEDFRHFVVEIGEKKSRRRRRKK